jgi:hypothetical protein
VPEVCVPGTTTGGGPDPCIYSVAEATGLIAARVGGHHPVEEVEMQFFRSAPPIPPHLRPPKRALTACLYISSFGDAIWVDRLVDGSLWITYIGYPRDEVLSGTGCCYRLTFHRLGGRLGRGGTFHTSRDSLAIRPPVSLCTGSRQRSTSPLHLVYYSVESESTGQAVVLTDQWGVVRASLGVRNRI